MLIIETSAAGEDTTSCTASSMSTVDSSSRSQHWDGSSKKEKSDITSHNTPHSKGGGSHGTNSSTDPTVQASRGERTTSNARVHPKAELKNNEKQMSNSNHASSKSHDRKRKASNEDDESEDTWTEHKSSSGRIYFYNKRLDKSQWEKPSKGTVKKLKTQDTKVPASSSSRSTSSTQHGSGTHASSSSSKSHSHSAHKGGGTHHSSSSHHHHHRDSRDVSGPGGQSNVHHHHHQSEYNTTPRRKTDKRPLSSSHASKANKSLTEGGVAGISSPPTTKPPSNTLSPLPQTPTSSRSLVGGVPVTPDNNMMIPPHILASYMGVVDPIGPKTPIQTYPSGWVGTGTGTPEVHPLQRAILIQNQYTTQGYQVSPHQQVISSVPTTPVQQHQSFPPPPPPPPPPSSSVHIPNAPSMNPQNVLMGYQSTPGGGGVYHYETRQQVPISSQKLKVPMSRLGAWPRPETDFPDPASLKPLPQLPSNDFYSFGLVQSWSSSIEPINKQMDSSQTESLSRTTVDVAYHCGQLAKNLLALECCRMKAVSRRTRLNDLMKTIDDIEKR
ncbi:PREDICTED: WW domain-containing adapter protein with coiled-coil-like isoform X2 [Amphimedon queenslandica]|uniref:WW domain-containing protein n=1 Tax=Amphimedon queenslandica TaxID=400682 RepID=A0AAN0JPU0_AMPQE|nr:PREDICTED: WW domain-containing adapter protein with coiled-coil-like isoform X2 [Amphimedon queenslandica]|eukprot:XP_019858818.1 PREDICTED: WW domain-containing adapter protein with coiled-coil-like isoform X2 [Amphimedon queenslandica]